ncbi:MAG TPA: hypothetical protein VE650_13320, partial [Acetobacteraceae bacterium]|nr:hypothetical protein [Acetobacteraceae bacterium]
AMPASISPARRSGADKSKEEAEPNQSQQIARHPAHAAEAQEGGCEDHCRDNNWGSPVRQGVWCTPVPARIRRGPG